MDKTVRDPDMPHNETSDISKARLRAWLQVLRVSRKIEGELREKMRLEFGSTLPRFDAAAFRCDGGAARGTRWHAHERAFKRVDGVKRQCHRDC